MNNFQNQNLFGGRRKVELDLSNYATKTDLKNETGVDTSQFVKNVDLASLKCNGDKLDLDKLKNAPTYLSNLKSKVDNLDVDELVPLNVDLSKLSDVVKNDVVKKDAYNAKIKNIRGKIPDLTKLTINTTLNAKINEVKKEIPCITNLGTTAVPNAKIRLKTKYLILLTELLLLLLLLWKIKYPILVISSKS